MASVLTLSSVSLGFVSNVAGGSTLLPISQELKLSEALRMTNGVGVGQCDLIYYGDLTLPVVGTSSGNVDLDLAGGGLLDPLGVALAAFARLKVFCAWLKASPAVTKVTIGNHGTAPMVMPWGTGAFDLRNGPTNADGYGGIVGFAAPDAVAWAVTATTADIIRFHNADAALTATVRVLLGGSSA